MRALLLLFLPAALATLASRPPDAPAEHARNRLCGRVAQREGVDATDTQGLTDREIRAARKLHVSKCAACHELHDPARYAATEWREWMEKMSRKAKLKPDQRELLSRYLEIRRTRSQTNAPPAARNGD